MRQSLKEPNLQYRQDRREPPRKECSSCSAFDSFGTWHRKPCFDLFLRVELTALHLSETHVKCAIDRILVTGEPVFLLLRGGEGRGFGFEQVERVSDEGGGVGVAFADELLLEALFEGGIEGERHGESIPPGSGRDVGLTLEDLPKVAGGVDDAMDEQRRA